MLEFRMFSNNNEKINMLKLYFVVVFLRVTKIAEQFAPVGLRAKSNTEKVCL